jgi:hypothetical protein
MMTQPGLNFNALMLRTSPNESILYRKSNRSLISFHRRLQSGLICLRYAALEFAKIELVLLVRFFWIGSRS